MNLEDLVSVGFVIFLLGFALGRIAGAFGVKKRFGLVRKLRFQKRLWNLKESTRNEHEEIGA